MVRIWSLDWIKTECRHNVIFRASSVSVSGGRFRGIPSVKLEMHCSWLDWFGIVGYSGGDFAIFMSDEPLGHFAFWGDFHGFDGEIFCGKRWWKPYYGFSSGDIRSMLSDRVAGSFHYLDPSNVCHPYHMASELSDIYNASRLGVSVTHWRLIRDLGIAEGGWGCLDGLLCGGITLRDRELVLRQKKSYWRPSLIERVFRDGLSSLDDYEWEYLLKDGQ